MFDDNQDDFDSTAATDAAEQDIRRFYGKYRGMVVTNVDPLNLGRLQALVPEVLGTMPTGWAYPVAPTAGVLAGFFAVPQSGSGVWIEFEAGDPSRPLWVGGFWGAGEIPPGPAAAPTMPTTKIFRSDTGLLISLNDLTSTITISDAVGTNQVVVSLVTGTVTLKGLARVVIESPFIFEGSATAAHPAVQGDALMTYLAQLVTQFNTHVHPGQANAGGPVSPAPPQPSFSPPSPTLISKKVFHE